MNNSLIRVIASIRFFEGEGSSGSGAGAGNPGTGTAAGGGAGGAGNPNPANQGNQNPTGNQGNRPGFPPTFTPEQQTHVNHLLAQEKQRLQASNQATVEQLRQLQENANLTQQQKEDLTSRIDQLTAEFQTKEQQQQSELQKLQKKYDTDTKKLTDERNDWNKRHDTYVIRTEIYRFANKFEAFHPEQVEAILAPLTSMVETLDAGGKPTGNREPRVKFPTKDKDNNPVVLELSIEDAVKQMTEKVDTYGNLFKTTANAGVGANPNDGATGGGRLPDINTMTPEQYKKHRETIHAEMRKQQARR